MNAQGAGAGGSGTGGGAGAGVGPGSSPAVDAPAPQSLAQQLGLEQRQLDTLITGFALAVARNPAPAASTPLLLVHNTRAVRVQSLDSGTNSGGGSGNGKAARVLPSGNDDDIIARRLRRAAQEETDPVLREKLWQEYLSYRQNAHAP